MTITDTMILKEYNGTKYDIGPIYICNFGKYSGKTALDVHKDMGYCLWLQKNRKSRDTMVLFDCITAINRIKYKIFKDQNYEGYKGFALDPFRLTYGKNQGKMVNEVDKSELSWFFNYPPMLEKNYIDVLRIELWCESLENIDTDKQNKSEENTDKQNKSEYLSKTVLETYDLFRFGITVEEIAKTRQILPATVIDHLSKCIDANLEIDVSRECTKETQNSIIDVIEEHFNGDVSKLKPIKDKCDEIGFNVSYGEIKLTVAALKKR